MSLESEFLDTIHELNEMILVRIAEFISENKDDIDISDYAKRADAIQKWFWINCERWHKSLKGDDDSDWETLHVMLQAYTEINGNLDRVEMFALRKTS